MPDQILDFIIEYPIVLIFLPLLVGMLLFRRFQYMKRRLDHIDAKSWSLVIIGFIGAAIAISIWLAFF
ncbi:MAG: hypothetical protein ACI87E_002200 [Mariniblastus sp.]|jgi:hypothetical protein